MAGSPNQAFTPLQLPQFKLEDLGHGENADKALAFFNQWSTALTNRANALSTLLRQHEDTISSLRKQLANKK